jgi:hypothetical protein
MNRPFPIFVDLATVPPLVIGNADILAAKLRLVLKFAPLAELITDRPDPSHLLVNPAARQLSGVTCNAAADQIKGRPLPRMRFLRRLPHWLMSIFIIAKLTRILLPLSSVLVQHRSNGHFIRTREKLKSWHRQTPNQMMICNPSTLR